MNKIITLDKAIENKDNGTIINRNNAILISLNKRIFTNNDRLIKGVDENDKELIKIRRIVGSLSRKFEIFLSRDIIIDEDVQLLGYATIKPKGIDEIYLKRDLVLSKSRNSKEEREHMYKIFKDRVRGVRYAEELFYLYTLTDTNHL